MDPFFVFGLPRSRTAWLSAMLSLGSRICYHEIESECESFADFTKTIRDDGNSSTAAWRLLPQLKIRFPKMRYIWVHRKANKLSESCAKAGFPQFDQYRIEGLWHEAFALGAMNQKTVKIEEVTMQSCLDIWDHLIPNETFPYRKVQNLIRMNIQLTDVEFGRITTTPIPWLMEATA